MTELEILVIYEKMFYQISLPFLKNIKHVLDNVLKHRHHEECNHCEEISGE